MKPSVDVDRLRPLLETLDPDSEMGKEFLIRGSPGNPIRNMTGDFNDSGIMVRTSEIAGCVKFESAWGFKFSNVADLIYKGVTRYLKGEFTVEQVGEFLEDKLELDLKPFTIAWAVDGLDIKGDAVRIGDYYYGRVNAVMEALEIEFADPPEDDHDHIVVCFHVEVPEEKHIRDHAYPIAMRGLSLLATTDLRSMFNTGSITAMRLGGKILYWGPGGQDVHWGIMSPWSAGDRFAVPRDTLEPTTRPRREAPIDPWTGLEGGDLRNRIRRAYELIGQAILVQQQAEASRALAIAALEIAYGTSGTQNGKKVTALARRLKLAVAKEGGITNPERFLDAFEERDLILHEGVVMTWNRDAARNHLSKIYDHLDELAAFCLKEGIRSQQDLTTRLDQAEIRDNAREWATKFQGWHKKAIKHVHHAETKRLHGAGIERWAKVIKAI